MAASAGSAFMERSSDPHMNSDLASLNSISPDEAKKEFLKCCGCNEWARRMVADRPFKDLEELTERAKSIWWQLQSRDWLEAFHSHPKIGETKAASETSVKSQQWSADEQSGLRDSAHETRNQLVILNRLYEEKFGHIFIICASGKTSEEMLEALRQRLENSREEELRIAASEQAKITKLRLKKLVTPSQL